MPPPPEPADPPEAPPGPDEVNRLWQHGMHEERLFHDRLNYFSAVQVGLLGVFAILYHKESAPGVLAPLIVVHLVALVPFRLVEAIVELATGGDPAGVLRPTVRAPSTHAAS